MTHAAHSVLDNDTGKKLNYGQLRKHPKFQETWKNMSQMKWVDYAKGSVKEKWTS